MPSTPVTVPPDSPRRRPRPELSRGRILEVAIALIDERGLAALGMRDLGAALGATTMAVYRHFASKAELLEAIMDAVVSDYAPTGPQRPWPEEARDLSRRVRASLLRHPELADVAGREFRRSETSLRVNAAIIERLQAGGVPAPFLPQVYWTLSSYTTGFALLEAQALRRRGVTPPGPAVARMRKISGFLAQVDGLSATTREEAAAVLARPLDDTQFEFGLETIIAGLAARFAAADQAQA